MSPSAAKFGLLTTLYLSQGLPFGFFTQALPVLLRKQGLSLPAIGLTSLLALPWALKFLWAPFVDAAPRRKSWIVPMQGLAALALLAIATLDPATALPAVLAGVFLINLLAATQDIATDGLAVDELSVQERGIGNGIQVAGYRVGMILGGGVMLIVFDYTGWPVTFAALAAILALASVPILLKDEKPRARMRADGQRPGFGSLWDVVRRPGMPGWLLILVLYKFGDSLSAGMLRPFLVDQGLGEAQLGWLLGTAGFTAGLLGALAGGWGTQKMGRWRALILFGLLQTLGGILYALAALGLSALPWLYLFCILEHFFSGLATAALFTMMMDRCEERSRGTDFTVLASVVVLATGLAQAVSGFLAQATGYAFHFWVSAVLCLVGMLVIRALMPRSLRLMDKPL